MRNGRPPAPFIVGVDRSGTTLLRLMLDAHSELAIPSETHFLPRLNVGRFRRMSRDKFLEIVTSVDTWPNMAVDERAFRDAVGALRPFTVSNGLRCLYGLYADRFAKTRWGDKTPHYREHLGLIAGLLPEAHFVHVIRDGRDVAVSLRGMWWGPGADIEGQARFWVRGVHAARGGAESVPHYREVRYEDLVREPEGTLREVCEFLALPFEQGMLAYHETAGERIAEYRQPFGPPEGRPGIESFIAIHEHVTQPPDAGRIGRWKTELTEDEVRRYEAIAGPLLRELGYSTTG